MLNWRNASDIYSEAIREQVIAVMSAAPNSDEIIENQCEFIQHI